MKKIYLMLATLSVCMGTQAQTLTKANNEPVAGDQEQIQEYDTVTVFPKNTGTGQVWNFSNLISSMNTGTSTYVTPASSPSPATFPMASLATNKGNTEWEYWKVGTSTFEYAGMIFSPGNSCVFSNTGVLYNWPIAYGSSNTDAFSATQTDGSDVSNWTGSISYTAVGTGTVILPGNTTYNNCLMLKRTINVYISGAYSQTMTMIDYDFWTPSLKFPILSMEYQTVIQGTTTSKSSYIDVNKAALTGISETAVSDPHLLLYPNPANTDLTITIYSNDENYVATLSDYSGKVLVSKENATSLDVSSLSNGIYIVTVKGTSFISHKTIAVTH